MSKINWAMIGAFVLIALVLAAQYYGASTGDGALWPDRLPGAGGLGNR